MSETHDEWSEVRAAEKDRAKRRRAWLKARGWCREGRAKEIGLALSGGGIRSATFSLGLLKSLSANRALANIDYLSTVSGGGYAGSFYCSLFVPQAMRGPGSAATGDNQTQPPDPEAHAAGLEEDVFKSRDGRNALAQLRQGGHYLAPNGTSDALFAAAIAIRNWLAVAIVTGITALTLFLFVYLLLAGAGADLVLLANELQLPMGETLANIWLTILLFLSFWPAACAWAFWFVRSDVCPLRRVWRPFSAQSAVALIIGVSAMDWAAGSLYPEQWPPIWRYSIIVASLGALAVYVGAEFRCYLGDCTPGIPDRATALEQEDRVRSVLSRWLFRGMFALLSVAGIAAITLLGRAAYASFFTSDSPETDFQAPAAVAATAAAVMSVARWFLKTPFGDAFKSRVMSVVTRRIGTISAFAAGAALVVLFLTFWAALAYGVMKPLLLLIDEKPGGGISVLSFKYMGIAAQPVALTLVLLLCAALMGRVDSLLNRSSLASFYAARLRKAYLGASNSERWPDPAGNAKRTVDEEDTSDDIRLDAYYHEDIRAPIHLINITINETTSASSRVIQRDRKGKPLVVCPSGILYPPGSAGGSLSLLKRKDSEDLPLSSWMAISGAAFSTGAGRHTSLGTALLASMTNLRLGYWWSRSRSTFWTRLRSKPVQSYLLRELRADFEGTTAERWYLSDGGHHENSGVYELVRRRIPLVIASDNGADPNYEFGDLVNLIRKLRIDFDTELTFLDDSQLDHLFGASPMRSVFGTLDQMRRRGEQAVKAADDPKVSPPKAGPYATLATIDYSQQGREAAFRGTLVWIKPRLTGRELPDLLQYRDANSAFPQQPTTDQFFDEAQWESYYRLGQLIGDEIFDASRFDDELGDCRWRPWDLKPLAADQLRSPRKAVAPTETSGPGATSDPRGPLGRIWKGVASLF